MNTPKGKQLITDATIQQQKIQKTTKPKFDELVGDFLSDDALKKSHRNIKFYRVYPSQ